MPMFYFVLLFQCLSLCVMGLRWDNSDGSACLSCSFLPLCGRLFMSLLLRPKCVIPILVFIPMLIIQMFVTKTFCCSTLQCLLLQCLFFQCLLFQSMLFTFLLFRLCVASLCTCSLGHFLLSCQCLFSN